MDEQKYMKLKAAGMDVEDALARFMGNEALMLKFLLRFPQDTGFSQLKTALEEGNVKEAFEAAHTLKGVTGNLSLSGLFQPLSTLVEDLRQGNLAAANSRIKDLEVQYQETVRILLELA